MNSSSLSLYPTQCYLCDSNLGKALLTIPSPDRFEQHLGIEGENFQRSWVSCPNCGAAINVQTQKAFNTLQGLSKNYYEVDFKSSTIKDKYELVMNLPPEGSDNAGRVRRIISFLNTLAPFQNSRSATSSSTFNAVDIGAGTGVFLSLFLKLVQADTKPWKATGYEPDPIAAAHLREIDLFSVEETIFTGSDCDPEADLITLNKVVEHIPQPQELLKSVRKKLRIGSGVFYMEVPDKETSNQRPPTDNILGSLHHHLYNINSLHHLLESCDFTVMQCGRVFEPSGKISVYAFSIHPETFQQWSQPSL